jgi:hypothetical protein
MIGECFNISEFEMVAQCFEKTRYAVQSSERRNESADLVEKVARKEQRDYKNEQQPNIERSAI